MFSPTESLSADLSSWYPCVGVQSPGGPPFEIQMNVVRELQAAGKMDWIRLSAYADGTSLPYHLEARSMGLKIFNIIHNSDLEILGWENAFDKLYSIYPGDVWEIGGEIQSEFINSEYTLTEEEYMDKLKKLSKHVKENYPGVILISGPPEGNTSWKGANTLENFISLGLLDLDVDIAINIYTYSSLVEYAAVLDRHAAELQGKTIWVTETGAPNMDQHIGWVQDFYARIRRSINPEMTCWYIMYGGEPGDLDWGHSLVTGMFEPTVTRSPLLDALVREKQ